MKRSLWVFAPLLLCVLVLSLFFVRLQQVAVPKPVVSPMLGKTVPDVALPSLIEEGKSGKISDLRGKYVLVSFFASWCIPCQEDHQTIMTLAKRQLPQLSLLGINWRDAPEDGRKWLTMHGLPFQQVLSDREGRAAIAFGITGVPESFLLSPEGVVLVHYAGVMTEPYFNSEMAPHIAGLPSLPAQTGSQQGATP